MSSATEQKRERPPILRWRGIMTDSARMLRCLVGLSLTVAGIVLTFTQLGFVSIAIPGESPGYLIVLLEVVALGALLLGTLAGAGIGLDYMFIGDSG